MGAIRKIRGISYLVKRLTKTSMQSKLVLGCVRRGVRHLQSPDRVWSGVHLVTSPIPGTLKIPPFGTSVSKRVPPMALSRTCLLATDTVARHVSPQARQQQIVVLLLLPIPCRNTRLLTSSNTHLRTVRTPMNSWSRTRYRPVCSKVFVYTACRYDLSLHSPQIFMVDQLVSVHESPYQSGDLRRPFSLKRSPTPFSGMAATKYNLGYLEMICCNCSLITTIILQCEGTDTLNKRSCFAFWWMCFLQQHRTRSCCIPKLPRPSFQSPSSYRGCTRLIRSRPYVIPLHWTGRFCQCACAGPK